MQVTITVKVQDTTDSEDVPATATAQIFITHSLPWTEGWRDQFSKTAAEAIVRYARGNKENE